MKRDIFSFKNSTSLHEFLKQASTRGPDLIVLCGPFLDENNTALDKSEFSFEDEFSIFLKNLREYTHELELQNTTFLFVPSNYCFFFFSQLINF